jgi:hypothetical protein
VSKSSLAVALASITVLLVGCSNASSDPATTSAASSPSSFALVEPSSTPAATPPTAPSAGSTTESATDAMTEAPAPAVEESVTPAVPLQPPATEPAQAAEHVVAVVTPDPVWEAVRITVPRGSSFTINGGGYQSGQPITINFGIAQSDGMVMDEQTAVADASGNYSFTITIGADLEPRTYAVLTYVLDGEQGGPDVEATKRFAIIDVVPA